MGAGVGLVAILVQHKVTVIALCQFLSQLHCPITALIPIRENDIRAIQFQHLMSLARYIIWHHRCEAISLNTGYHRQGDTRITAGRL